MMEYRFLRFVPFVELTRWDYNSYFKEKSIKSQYEIVELLEVLKDLTKERQFTIDDKVEYSEPTISSKLNTITARKTGLGKEFKVKKRVLIKPNDLVIAKMHTQNGLFAISNDEFASTNTFIPLEIKGNIDKNYLLSLLKTTLARLEKFDSVNRETYSVDEILSLHLPLPPLATQKALVEAYTAKTTEAKQKEALATELEKSIDEYLTTELGIEVQKKEVVESKYTFLRFVGFAELERWDYKSITESSKETHKTRYDLIQIKKMIQYFAVDKSKKSLKVNTFQTNSKDTFLYIGMENVEKDTGNISMQNVIGEEIKSQTIRVPNGYFIYGKLRPYLNKYWLNTTDNNNIICSSEFLVFSIFDNINKEYFKYLISSSIAQSQMSPYYSGARMPRISFEIFQKIQLPLPPLAVQNRIATHITHLKEQIKALRLEAKTLQAEAKQEFETAVFG